MTKLAQLYAEQKRLKGKKVTGTASAMHRHQRLLRLQREIDYYELGDTISRQEIQEKLAEIKMIQEEIDLLTLKLTERRTQLMAHVFGPHQLMLNDSL